mmetsp:Transcript_5425/g.20259  ORF Transcript_5425/g.20259 Transcript_5425/m.20259 type:complete len:311 (+) Transcript_5425:308-1240(+)
MLQTQTLEPATGKLTMSIRFPKYAASSQFPNSTTGHSEQSSNSLTSFTAEQESLFTSFITQNEIILIQKGESHLPYCRYSKQIATRLVREGIRYYAFNVWQARELAESGDESASQFVDHLKARAGCTTFPQLWVHGRFISNLDALSAFDEHAMELGESLHGILGDQWVEHVPHVGIPPLLIRIRNPRTGHVESMTSLEHAKQFAQEQKLVKLNLIKNPGPGYQNILEDDSNFPETGVVVLFGEANEAESEDEQLLLEQRPLQQRRKKSTSKWLMAVPAIIGIGLFVWFEWSNLTPSEQQPAHSHAEHRKD